MSVNHILCIREKNFTAYKVVILPIFCSRKLFNSFNRQCFTSEARPHNSKRCRKPNPMLISELRHFPYDPILTKADDTKKMTFMPVYTPIKEQYHVV